MEALKRINMTFTIAILAVCCFAYAIFGWAGSGWKALAIPTGSMRPTFPIGSLVFVHRVPISSLKVGDVITYVNPRDPKMTISHRIVKEYSASRVLTFVTKGDANEFNDPPVTNGFVQGRVIGHVPHAGYWMLDAKKPLIILPILYLIGLLTMIEEFKRLKAYYKTQAPYILAGYIPHELPKRSFAKLYTWLSLSLGMLVTLSIFGPSALAALRSNMVALSPNRITIGHIAPKCSNNSSVTINNTTTQNSSSGNAKNSNGSATSGNASNSNSSSFGVTVTQC